MNNQNLFEALKNICGFTALDSDVQEIINAHKKDMIALHQPINASLPTDLEIERWAYDKYHEVEDSRWYEPLIEGAKWMRTKLV